MIYGSMSAWRFRNVAAITTASFRRQPSMSATYSSSSSLAISSSPHKRVTLTLYRQLLRWCKDTDDNIPLSQSIPPIHMSPPQINSNSLLGLIESQDGIFTRSTSVVKESGITIHSVPTSNAAKQMIKAVFRMNAVTTDEQDMKEQLSIAFEWVKTLNELTKQLEEMTIKRRKRLNREGVKYKIGQVVKHEKLAWRGVILGWTRQENSNENTSRATSLTQKQYESINPSDRDDGRDVTYDVALDWGDATLLSSAKHPSGLKNVYQSDLVLVDDPDLMRIRSTTDQFRRFDPKYQCFIPGDTLTYIYPNDKPTNKDNSDDWNSYENPSDEAANNISQGIRSFADHLRQIILSYTSAPESRNLRLLAGYFKKLTKLSKGDVVPAQDRFRSGLVGVGSDESGRQQRDSAITQTTMKWELQSLVELAVEIEDILWTRRKALETDRSIKFSLGEYVQHKKYGFRGVVVGWDPGTLLLS